MRLCRIRRDRSQLPRFCLPCLRLACFRLACLVVLVASLLKVDVLQLQASDSELPNILFLFADDQRTDTIGAYGNEHIRTPNIDQLANGFNFRNTYCFGSPHGAVCIPSRAMLHTGRSLFRIPNLNMEGCVTMGELLGQNGYETFGTGKWHNQGQSFIRSFQRGKNVMLGGMSDHSKVPIVDLRDDQTFTEQRQGENFSSKLFADAAIEFLGSRDQSKPFFCYVAFTAPHDPRMSPGSYNRMYDPDDMVLPDNFMPQHPFNNGQLTTRDENLGGWPRTREMVQHQTAEYYGLISHMDEQIGRILDALDEDVRKNTIIVFAADHGLGMGSHGLLGKQSLYEHSMKAPLMISGPAISSGSTDALVYLHDLFPTVLGFAGVEVPATANGHSLRPLMDGNEKGWRNSLFTTYGKNMRAVRDERWKLIRYPQIDVTQLFDLQNDPQEKNNLAKDIHYATQVAKMLGKLEVWQNMVGDEQPLVVDQVKPKEIDLTGRARKPDRWQPRWIVDKYFDPQPEEQSDGDAGKGQDSKSKKKRSN